MQHIWAILSFKEKSETMLTASIPLKLKSEIRQKQKDLLST